jgi:tape measure domain-containing protein
VAGDNIGSVALEIQAALDAASWNAAQAAAQSQGRIIGTQLAKAIQDTVNQQTITITPRVDGVSGGRIAGNLFDQFRQQATPPPLPPAVPPGYLQQLQAAQAGQAGLAQSLGQTAAAGGQAAGGLGQVSGAINALAAGVKGFLALELVQVLGRIGGAAIGAARGLVQLAGEQQKINAALKFLSGSEAAAIQLRDTIFNLSQSTPFSNDQIKGVARQYLAVGIEAEKLEGTINRIGAVATQAGQPLERIALIYGQIFAKGRLQGQEVLQLQEAGVSITRQLEQVTGLYGTALQDAISRGQIGIPQVNAAITLLTGNMEALAEAGKATDNALRGISDKAQQFEKELAASLAPAFTGVFNVVNDAFNQLFDGNPSKFRKELFAPLAEEARRFTEQLEKNPELVQALASAINSLATTGVQILVRAFEGINAALEQNPEGLKNAIIQIELALRRSLIIAEGLINAIAIAGRLQDVANPLTLRNPFERAGDLAGVINDGFQNSIDTAQRLADANPLEIDLTVKPPEARELAGGFDNGPDRAAQGRQAQILAQQAEQVARINDQRQSIVAAATREATLAEEVNGIYNDRTLSFQAQQAAVAAITGQLEQQERFARALEEYDRARAEFARLQASQAAQASAGQDAAASNARRGAQSAAESIEGAFDGAAARLLGTGEAAGQAARAAGQGAAETVGGIGAAASSQLDQARLRVLQAGEDFRKVVSQLSQELNRNVAQAAAALQRGDVLDLRVTGADRVTQGIADAFEIGTARVVEVFDFAQSLITQAGGSVTTVGQALIDQLGREGVALVDGFNRSFEAAKEAAANLAQAADRLQGSRAGLERAGLLSATAQQQGIERALSQIRQTGFGNSDINQQALAQAIRDGLRSDNPLAALSSLADQLRANFGARQDVDSAAKTFKDATERAAASQDNLAAAINQLIPQIAVSVSVPVGSSVTSNAEVRYN